MRIRLQAGEGCSPALAYDDGRMPRRREAVLALTRGMRENARLA
jgi:hypothetical protein